MRINIYVSIQGQGYLNKSVNRTTYDIMEPSHDGMMDQNCCWIMYIYLYLVQQIMNFNYRFEQVMQKKYAE